MKLELKHLLPYSLYELMLSNRLPGWSPQQVMKFDDLKWLLANQKCVKPILRPLSDLTKEIGCTVTSDWIMEEMGYEEKYLSYLSDFIADKVLPYEIFEKLFELHFDVFGLIEKGLAVDINTIAT